MIVSDPGLNDARGRLAVALDVDSLEQAKELASTVAPFARVVKVGLELFVAHGPAAVREVIAACSPSACEVFLDLKLHDIPETVARSVKAARDHGVRFLTVHASGGPRMLEAASRAREGSSLELLAVTVLTSLDAGDLSALGIGTGVEEHVARLAALARNVGVRGFVSSVAEAARIKRVASDAFVVTPGIRPASASKDDQRRVATPADAIKNGADLLVVGRPIRDAADRAGTALAIQQEILAALPKRP